MREMSVTEKRYKAVLAVIGDGRTVSEVSTDWGVSRRTMPRWLARYEGDGLEGLNNRSHRPAQSPHDRLIPDNNGRALGRDLQRDQRRRVRGRAGQPASRMGSGSDRNSDRVAGARGSGGDVSRDARAPLPHL